MKDSSLSINIISLLFGLALLVVGVLNLFLVHPVPGAAYLLLSFVFFPRTNGFLRERYGWQIPLLIKIILAIIIVMFTLGVSDLGDMIDGF